MPSLCDGLAVPWPPLASVPLVFYYDPTTYFNSPFLNQVLTRFQNPVEDWVVFRHRDPASTCTP
jgi:hypothetical protein